MPIIDVQLVIGAGEVPAPGQAARLANDLGRVLNASPGTVWVKLRTLSAAQYAENDAEVVSDELPVFVSILHAVPPNNHALAKEVQGITAAVARCVGRPMQRVHIEYASAGAGRVAFGGNLV